MGHEPVTSSVAGACFSHSATANQQVQSCADGESSIDNIPTLYWPVYAPFVLSHGKQLTSELSGVLTARGEPLAAYRRTESLSKSSFFDFESVSVRHRVVSRAVWILNTKCMLSTLGAARLTARRAWRSPRAVRMLLKSNSASLTRLLNAFFCWLGCKRSRGSV